MKKLILFFLAFTFNNIFSQQYHFDYFIEKQINKVKPDKERIISNSFYDSNNKFKLTLDTYNEITRGFIFDKNTNLRHCFKVRRDNGSVSFQYVHTNDFSNKKNNKDYSKDDILEIKRIDSLQYSIIVFKNEKRKRKRFTAVVNLEKSDFNNLDIQADYNRCDEIGKEIGKLLDPRFNYNIKKLQINYSSGYIFETTISRIQKVDLSLKLPEKLIIKEFDFFGEFQD